MTEPTWMVRAGEGGFLIDEFRKGKVAVGWAQVGDLSQLKTRESIMQALRQAFPQDNEGKRINHAGVLYKFRWVIQPGHGVVTYDPEARMYLVGRVTGDYEHDPNGIKDYPNERAVSWHKRVERDLLPVAARNSLGSTLALFQLNDDVLKSLTQAEEGRPAFPPESPSAEQETLEQIKEDTQAKAHELIKDKILALDPEKLEQLLAAIFRAMGYKARVADRGPDRGVDVIASPDGLLLERPRIKAQVKHRPGTQMRAEQIRSFLGGLREGDAALYVSTGGFSKDARYEADRSNIPIMLLGLDDLARLIVTHYESFDMEGRVLLPLVKLYWPAE
jgi:restriction system protein